VKLGLTAGKVYTAIEVGSGIIAAANKGYKLATSNEKMTVWEMAGAIGSMGLDLLPAGGALAGKLAKQFSGPDFMRFDGCFAGGTVVHVQASGVRRQTSGKSATALACREQVLSSYGPACEDSAHARSNSLLSASGRRAEDGKGEVGSAKFESDRFQFEDAHQRDIAFTRVGSCKLSFDLFL
jgi:hypothetical protein